MDGVVVWVKDLGRASAFYGLVLDLTEADRSKDYVAFETGLSRVVLIPRVSKEEGIEPQVGGSSPVLEVENLERFKEKLLSVGAEICSDSFVGAPQFAFRDSEGNLLFAIAPPQPPPQILLAEAEVDEGGTLL